jgi:hypothetical protein
VQSQSLIEDTIEANMEPSDSDSSEASDRPVVCERGSVSSESCVWTHHSPPEGIAVSLSAEKISTRETSPMTSKSMQSSRSHENYLESNNGGGGACMSFVDIDFEDQMASSVDALLHYECSNTSIDSSEVSPEHKVRAPSMLSGQEPSIINRLKDGKRKEPCAAPKTVTVGAEIGESTTDPVRPPPPPRTCSNPNPLPPDVSSPLLVQVAAEEASPPCSGPPSPGGDSVDLYHQPAKDPHRPSAARLAKRLFHMDGFRKSDVTKHLSKK